MMTVALPTEGIQTEVCFSPIAIVELPFSDYFESKNPTCLICHCILSTTARSRYKSGACLQQGLEGW